ncbi:MAG: histidinol-phosphate transaminase [Bacteroidetes bacterium]|nr:MAG: histidinol-phosphate transaminase [Bacteroidota bacterium]
MDKQMNFNLDALIRPNIKSLKPYSSARHEFTGEASVYLDANENSLGSPLPKWYNRYPDPLQAQLKEKLSHIKQVPPQQMFLGNGSDECIDLLFRSFCRPGVDNIIICPPTYGMYSVSANINDTAIRTAPLLDDYQLNLAHIEQLADANTKIIWLCSPNNPTGNDLHRADIEVVLNNFNGLVVVDEAYINFSRQATFAKQLADYPNLVVLQTLSKAWGLAGLRLGIMMASPEIIAIINTVKAPYNIAQPTQDLAIKALDNMADVNQMIHLIVDMRNALAEVFEQMPIVEKVYPSAANFFLVKMYGAKQVYDYLISRGIVVRDRSNVQFCDNALRITVGTEQENTQLVDAMADYMDLLAAQNN